MKGLGWDEENWESRRDFYKEIKWIAKTRKVPESSIELDVNHPVGEIVIFIDGIYCGYLDSQFYDFMEAFPEFEDYFCRPDSYGLRLQNDDSWLAHKVLKHFVDQGKPCLPVHDSFIVKRSDIDLLTKAMGDSFREQFDVEEWVPVTISWKDEGEVYKKSVVV